jgi:hypothetical protein
MLHEALTGLAGWELEMENDYAHAPALAVLLFHNNDDDYDSKNGDTLALSLTLTGRVAGLQRILGHIYRNMDYCTFSSLAP